MSGKNRFVDELHIPDPRNNLARSELLSEQAIAKEGGPCSTEMKQSSIEETRADSVKTLSDPVYFTKGIVPMKEKKWKSIPAYLPIIQRETSFNRDLEIVHEIGTPL